MIFDCDHVSQLVRQWQDTSDSSLLNDIGEGCRKLVEAIVSSYGEPDDREDMIQESFARIFYAIRFYDPSYPSTNGLYSYLSTVIHNACATYIRKQHAESCDELTDAVDVDHSMLSDDVLLQELITHNRQRFPSLPVSELDELTEALYYAIKYGDKPRTIIVNAVPSCIPKQLVSVVYNSMLIYMRVKNVSCSRQDSKVAEFSLLKDLEEVLDQKSYRLVLIAFAGMNLRIPV